MSNPFPNGVPGLTPADWDHIHEAVQQVLT